MKYRIYYTLGEQDKLMDNPWWSFDHFPKFRVGRYIDYSDIVPPYWKEEFYMDVNMTEDQLLVLKLRCNFRYKRHA